MPRDTMMTVIDLKKCLGMEPSEKKGLFIITNFNKLNIAFHVDEVIGIHRVSWEDIIKPDSTINTEDKSAATGVIKLEGKLVVILDFEKIVTDISPETGLKVSEISGLEGRQPGNRTESIRCGGENSQRQKRFSNPHCRGFPTAWKNDLRVSEKIRIHESDHDNERTGGVG